jgi:hypothetical protein
VDRQVQKVAEIARTGKRLPPVCTALVMWATKNVPKPPQGLVEATASATGGFAAS